MKVTFTDICGHQGSWGSGTSLWNPSDGVKQVLPEFLPRKGIQGWSLLAQGAQIILINTSVARQVVDTSSSFWTFKETEVMDSFSSPEMRQGLISQAAYKLAIVPITGAQLDSSSNGFSCPQSFPCGIRYLSPPHPTTIPLSLVPSPPHASACGTAKPVSTSWAPRLLESPCFSLPSPQLVNGTFPLPVALKHSQPSVS